MRQSNCLDHLFDRLRAGFLRGVYVLAMTSSATIFAPGFHHLEKANHDDGIANLWPGTSAAAKRRRHSGESGEPLGRFSDGTTTNSGNSGSSSTSNSSSSSNSAGANGSNSGTNSAPTTDNNTRSSDNGHGRNSGRRDDDASAGANSGGPPATLADTFKAWFDQSKPAQGPSATPATAPADVKSPSKSSLGVPNPDVTGKGGNTAPRGPRGIPQPSTYQAEIGGRAQSSGEVLGVRLSPKSVEALQGMGFTVPPQAKTSFDVLRIYTPQGVDAAQAQDLLRQAMPKEKFETNKFYRIYHARSGSGAAHGVVGASSELNCAGNKCMARDMLHWSPDRLSACSSGVSVGVLDTGIDEQHPALAHRYSGVFIPEGRAPAPTWHGTAVFALLAGNPKSGTPGFIPKAKLYHGSVFFSDHTDEFATDTHVLLHALDWMHAQGVKIVNMSFAGPHDPLIEEAIAKLSAKGMIFIAAVGNDGPGADPVYPAAYRQVIAVTAIKADRRIYPYANRGRHIDIAAPGVDIWTAVPGAREGYYTGTSFATPFVTALVATLYSANPTPAKEKLLAQLDYDDLGIPGRDSTYGRGLPIAPRVCVSPPVVADNPPTAPRWGTTIVEKHAPSAPSTPPAISAGFR